MTNRQEGGERAILVHLHLRDKNQTADFQEFRELALSAGAIVVDISVSKRDVPDSKYFLGSGKAEELREMVALHHAEIVLFDHELTPSQERNLEKLLKCRVLDRTGLILDIFAQRARTFEGKLQVELAQLKHHSTRLIRGWTHLERQKGGIGLRGPGETQLEVDRRLIRKRIQHLIQRLEQLAEQRGLSRHARQNALLPMIALVGYTNAGKSTLFNALTGAEVLVENKLFATLDPTIRSMQVLRLGKVVLADTVGFISKLPHHLVEAFSATLEEVKNADLLLHVIDNQEDAKDFRIKQVEEVLEQIDALAVPRIEVYNKIDISPTRTLPRIERDNLGSVRRVYVSASKLQGFDLLQTAIAECLSGRIVEGKLFLPSRAARLRAILYEMGFLIEEEEEEEGWLVTFTMPQFKWQELCRTSPELENYWKVE